MLSLWTWRPDRMARRLPDVPRTEIRRQMRALGYARRAYWREVAEAVAVGVIVLVPVVASVALMLWANVEQMLPREAATHAVHDDSRVLP